MSDIIEALMELIAMGVVEAAKDESGNIIRRNGEICWAAVPEERLTDEQKAFLKLRCDKAVSD